MVVSVAGVHVVEFGTYTYETTDTGLVYRAVCPFTPQLSLVLIAPTHKGIARLS